MESAWWPEEHWWEKKVIPLGFFTVSFRQFVVIAVAAFAGYLASLPVNFAIASVSFAGRAVVFCTFLLFGTAMAKRRVKLVPVELQILYVLLRRQAKGAGRVD